MSNIFGHKCGQDGCRGRTHGDNYFCVAHARIFGLLPERTPVGPGPRLPALTSVAIMALVATALFCGVTCLLRWTVSVSGMVSLFCFFTSPLALAFLVPKTADRLAALILITGTLCFGGFWPALVQRQQQDTQKMIEPLMKSFPLQMPTPSQH